METAVAPVEEKVAPEERDEALGAGEPAWDIAELFPCQGAWSEEEYFSLPGNRLVEFRHGWIEVLPIPTETHQRIAFLIARLLAAFVEARSLGIVLFSGTRVRLAPGKYREPDVVFMRAEHSARRHEQFWEGADLVMEVVSPDYRRHDLETKRREYARAGIPEYWIVDPEEKRIEVLALQGRRYRVHGVFTPGTQATSAALPGFMVAVDDVFAAGGE
ncbi:MAG: Uma2 family endonuclease [Armatimonadetes bacterium]|nr:Uma2 family endonuclease [Armatimonadota bacterium]